MLSLVCQAGENRRRWTDDQVSHPLYQPLAKPFPGSLQMQPAPIAPQEQLGAIVGESSSHIVRQTDTLLDIARRYDLGYNELGDLYPHYDPWMPPVGKILALPTQRLLPASEYRDIVINIPEMRLYAYAGNNTKLTVKSYPIGIGAPDFPTPIGNFFIADKRIRPTWHIPPSLREKYPQKQIPPGPNNPLGDYWLRLKGTMYGIHGTNMPWSVGRTATHGCIRMYPEDIGAFYASVSTGTKVRLVYEPVKTAMVGNLIYIEIHRDVYNRIESMINLTWAKLTGLGKELRIDRNKLQLELDRQSGIPVEISLP